MTNVIFTGYFNISFLFAFVKVPIIVMYGQTEGVEKRIITYIDIICIQNIYRIILILL